MADRQFYDEVYTRRKERRNQETAVPPPTLAQARPSPSPVPRQQQRQAGRRTTVEMGMQDVDLDAIDYALLRAESPNFAERVEQWVSMGIDPDRIRRRAIEAGIDKSVAEMACNAARCLYRHLEVEEEIEALPRNDINDSAYAVLLDDWEGMSRLIDSHLRALARVENGQGNITRIWRDRQQRLQKHIADMLQRIDPRSFIEED